MKESTKYHLIIILILSVALIVTIALGIAFGFPIIAVNESNVSTAIFDFWTVGHLLVGLAFFVFLFTIGFISKNLEHPNQQGPATLKTPGEKDFARYWLYTVLLAVIWEIVENTLLYFLGVKTKFDSAVNISTDIIIWSFGGLASWIMTELMFVTEEYLKAYYIYGVINLFTGVIIFIVFGFLTMSF